MKKYVKPVMDIIEVTQKYCLLTGSDPKVGNDYQSGQRTLSRQSNGFWDEEE
jgi:hypothetical protein